MTIKTIEELQQEFLDKLQVYFGEWIDFEWKTFITKDHSFQAIIKEYNKNILAYLPYPIGKLVFENVQSNKTNISIEEIYKYLRSERTHSFSETDNERIKLEIDYLSEEVRTIVEIEDYYYNYGDDDVYDDEQYWYSD